MRRLLVASVVALIAQAAQAADPADLPILRGSFREAPRVQRTVWEGFYVGGQFGYGSANMGFDIFNETGWPIIPPNSSRTSAWGGFAGYNIQFENVIVGIDASAMHGTFQASAFNESTTTQLNVGPVPGTDLILVRRTDGAMALKDWGSLRVRGGYLAGDLLPYAFAGVAMGRADTFKAISLTGTYVSGGVPVLGTPRVSSISSDTNDLFTYGIAVGVGLDWMLLGGMFVRAEYEYLQFPSTLNTNVHSVRGGVGYKF